MDIYILVQLYMIKIQVEYNCVRYSGTVMLIVNEE